MPLTPSEELMMEVLASRSRLGEPFWTFDRRHLRTARNLLAKNYVVEIKFPTENLITVEANRSKLEKDFLREGYIPPALGVVRV